MAITPPAPAPPLWSVVLADLRARLAAGEFASRFPTDAELVAQYGVSRHTAREAVRHLQDEGVLERRRGRGSYLSRRPIEQPLGALYSLFRSIEERGMVQDSVVRALDERCDPGAASRLGLEPGQPLVYLERVRCADGEPVALDRSWLPAAVARPLLEVDFTHTALDEQLAERCGIRLSGGQERILPVLPDPLQRRLLGVGARVPAFAVERTTWSGRRTVEWRNSVVRGDRFGFVARWSSPEQIQSGFEPTDA